MKATFVDVEVLTRLENENRGAITRHEEKDICKRVLGNIIDESTTHFIRFHSSTVLFVGQIPWSV